MEFYGVKLPLVKEGDDYVKIIIDSVKECGHALEDNDILVIASKVVSTALGVECTSVCHTLLHESVSQLGACPSSFVSY